jgi:ankyrin repeat protein
MTVVPHRTWAQKVNISHQNSLRIVDIFLGRDVDVNAQRQYRQTPLHLACYHGKHEIAQLLLDRGANANAEDNALCTPLHQVAGGQYPSQEDGIRVARLLLEHGADINAQNPNRETPLHVASAYGRLEIARMLLERTILKNDQGQNPSHLCLEGEYCASK